MLGQKILSQNKYLESGLNSIPIELPSLVSNGVYIVKLQINGQTLSGKVSIFK